MRALPLVLLALVASCRDRAAAPPAPAPVAAPPPAPAPPSSPPAASDADAGGAAAAPSTADERRYQQGLLDYDRGHLAFFTEALGEIKKAVARYDAIVAQLDKDRNVGKAREAVEAAARSVAAPMKALAKRVDALDGARSNAVPELQLLVYEVETGYPNAIRDRLNGREWPLPQKRAVVAGRVGELETWLAGLRR